MSLEPVRRKDREAWQARGTIQYPDETSERVRKTLNAKSLPEARRECQDLLQEKLNLWRTGKRRGSTLFVDAIESWMVSQKREDSEKARITRIAEALGDKITCGEVDQSVVNRLKKEMFWSAVPDWSTDLLSDKNLIRKRANGIKEVYREPSDATVLRAIISPIRSVLRHANMLGWCDVPRFVMAKQPEGRTDFLYPEDVRKLVAAAAPHIKPLILFLVGTGARMGEAMNLRWRDVDLLGATATFWGTRIDDDGNKRRGTKSGKRRVADMPPITITALRMLAAESAAKPDDKVFLRPTIGKNPRMTTYVERRTKTQGSVYGGQIKRAWEGAKRRAGIDPIYTPHHLRHTWATWHYAVNRDILQLQQDGGWSSVLLVQRYAKLMPKGYKEAIEAFLSGIAAVDKPEAAD